MTNYIFSESSDSETLISGVFGTSRRSLGLSRRHQLKVEISRFRQISSILSNLVVFSGNLIGIGVHVGGSLQPCREVPKTLEMNVSELELSENI